MSVLLLGAALAVARADVPGPCSGPRNERADALSQRPAVDTDGLLERVRTLLWEPPDAAEYRVIDPVEMTWTAGWSSLEWWAPPACHPSLTWDPATTVHGLLSGTPTSLVTASALYLEQIRATPYVRDDLCADLTIPGTQQIIQPAGFACAATERLAVRGSPHPGLLVMIVTGWMPQVLSEADTDGVSARDVVAWRQLTRAADDERAIAAVADALVSHPLPADRATLDELRAALRAFWRAADHTDNELRALYRDLANGSRDAQEPCGPEQCLLLTAFFARRLGGSDRGPDLVRLYRWAMVRSAHRLGMPEAREWAHSLRPQLQSSGLQDRERYLAVLDAEAAPR